MTESAITRMRMVGAVRVTPGTRVYIRRRTAAGPGAWGSWQTVNLADGLYYPISGFSGADDLLQLVQTALNGAHSPASELLVEISLTGGIVYIGDEGNTYDHEIRFTDPSSPVFAGHGWAVADGLGFLRSETIAIGDGESVTATRSPRGSWYPSFDFVEYLPSRVFRGNQRRYDHGQVDTSRVAYHDEARLRVRIEESALSTAWDDWHAWRDWMAWAAQGMPFRIYPQRNLTTAYADQDTVSDSAVNTSGYRTWVLSVDSMGWSPEGTGGQMLLHFESEVDLRAYVAPS